MDIEGFTGAKQSARLSPCAIASEMESEVQAIAALTKDIAHVMELRMKLLVIWHRCNYNPKQKKLVDWSHAKSYAHPPFIELLLNC